MAKGKKTGGKSFEVGNKANPIGAAAHNPITKALRRLTQEDVADIGSLILSGNKDELQRIKDDPTSSFLRAWFCSVALKAFASGDATQVNVLLDRIIGKTKEKTEVDQKIEVIIKNYVRETKREDEG